MKIAIIAWGSLIRDPRSLQYVGDWQPGGPSLSLEFSRVSKDCRLTLVIDGEYGRQVPTRFVRSKRRNLKDAIADLRDREGTIWSRIGYVDKNTALNSADTFSQPEPTFRTIEEWTKANDFDAAIWTALPPSFQEQTGKKFTVEEAAKYIQNLPKCARKVAIEYLEKAPKEVVTPLREHLAATGIIAPKERWGVT